MKFIKICRYSGTTKYTGHKPETHEEIVRFLDKLQIIALPSVSSINGSLNFIFKYALGYDKFPSWLSPTDLLNLPGHNGDIQTYKYGLYIASANINNIPIMTFFVIPGPGNTFQCHKYIFKRLEIFFANESGRKIDHIPSALSLKLHSFAMNTLGTGYLITRPLAKMKELILIHGGKRDMNTLKRLHFQKWVVMWCIYQEMRCCLIFPHQETHHLKMKI
jgi:hypothetical protein